MALNWLEDIVSHLYKLKGYVVIENADLLMPRTEYRQVRGHSDIDVMAIKDSELIHIECQSGWAPSKKDEQKEFRRLKERFEQARRLVHERYLFLNQSSIRIRNVFVTSDYTRKKLRGGPWYRLQQFCSGNEIELMEIKEVVGELLTELKRRYPRSQNLGKEEGIARAFLYLIHNDFLKEEIP